MAELAGPRFAGKVALITGAARGLGLAIALRLAREGAKVAINDVSTAETDAAVNLVHAGGAEACVCLADVSDNTAVAAMVAKAEQQLGPIDILVNNAGIGDFVGWKDITPSKWARMLNIHLSGTFNCCKAVLPGMIERGAGKILNVSSVSGKRGDFGGNAHYTAAKAGIIGLTKSLAADVAAKGVNVNAIAPGIVNTELTREMSTEWKAKTLSRVPIERFATPEEIAAAAAFLVSDDASYIIGETLSVNGGSYMD